MRTTARYFNLLAAVLLVVASTPIWRTAFAQTLNRPEAKLSLPASLGQTPSDALKALADRLAADSGSVDIVMSDGRSPTVGKPTGLIATAPMVLLGRSSLNAPDAAELITWMKATGSAVRVGHDGGWSASHACALQVQELISSKATLVGAAPGTTALAMLKSGTIDVLCEAVPLAMSEITAGTVTAYILAAEERVANLWDLQTADQAGVPLFSASVWLGLYAAGEDPVRQALNAVLQKALSDDVLVQTLIDAGWTPFPLTHRSAVSHATYAVDDAERSANIFARVGIAPPTR